MNNYEDWAQLVARKLKGEANVIAAIEKDELDDAAAAEAFVRAVLTPFLPENFGVGAGHVVDAFGNRSGYFDAIIYNRDFPRIGLRGIQSDYLYESVLAAFTIRAKYIRKTFFDSMNTCASLATLSTNTDKSVLVRLAKKNGLRPGPNKSFIHEDPLHTTRFELIGCPPAFMFGFSGIKNSYRQLQENIELWIMQRQADDIDTPMRAFPAVIATQGCFAWRNAAPLALSNREMLGIGNDPAPIRLIVLQMLYLLNRRLHATANDYGMKPNLNAYLSQFKPPKFEIGVGDVNQLVSAKLPSEATQADVRKDFEPARDHAPEAVAAATVSDQPATDAPEVAELPEKIGETLSLTGVFDKPSPFASTPAPEVADPQPAENVESIPRPPAAPLGSAPIPGVASSAAAVEPETEPMPVPEAEPSPPVAPLGSAPIPPSQPAEPASNVIPPIPPVDIELTGETEIPQEIAAEPDYDTTVVIKPDAATMGKNQAKSSTDAFIARVKEQLSNPESQPGKDEDAFTSTVPQ
ncbi:MAG: hypothetical protein GY875_10530 [Gammaproteobacteria bacterium]|nr:hypothetical protein [Gammaproteobacteria bacterium]